MKQRAAAFTVFLLACALLFPTGILGQATFQEISPSGYGFLVNGLRQFPHAGWDSYWRMGTLAGFSAYCDGFLASDKDLTCYTLKVVTKEDKLINLQIVGGKMVMALFFHEFRPEWGKYRFWEPVFMFTLDPSKKRLSPVDLRMIGRFRVHWNKVKHNKVDKYENERYW